MDTLFTDKVLGIVVLVSATVLTSVGAMRSRAVGRWRTIYLAELRLAAGTPDHQAPVLEGGRHPNRRYGKDFAMLFVTQILHRWCPASQVFNGASAAIVMGIMIRQLVSSMSEDAMSAVPRGLREGAYAVGATRLEGHANRGTGGVLGHRGGLHPGHLGAVGDNDDVAVAAGQSPR